MWYFFDTSAFVKRYKPEVGSEIVQGVWGEAASMVIVCAITLVETYAALYRHSRKGRLSPGELAKALDGVTADLESSRLHVLDVTSHHVARTRHLLAEHELTSHDAVILAAALDLKAFDVIFVCADVRSGLLAAAAASGLSTLNPLTPT
ncbi:MAG: type II toxin-antitoxin system VapC family toxin [Candidatus Omnitrophota bacterium]|nr:type II toxin-antitoxin system VapC family toxin [Candidatus Omnitrophota bacterium]